MIPVAASMRYVFHLFALARWHHSRVQSRVAGVMAFPRNPAEAHWHVFRDWRAIRTKRLAVKRRLESRQMSVLLKRHRISLYAVASL